MMKTSMLMAKGLAVALLLACVVGSAGCGTDVGALFGEIMAASGRTALDVWLTDLANAGVQADDADADDGDGAASDDGGDGTSGDLDSLTGDAEAGATLYAAQSCSMCHGEAPGDLGGVTAATLDARLRGDEPHSKFDLTDQEIVDLAALLGA